VREQLVRARQLPAIGFGLHDLAAQLIRVGDHGIHDAAGETFTEYAQHDADFLRVHGPDACCTRFAVAVFRRGLRLRVQTPQLADERACSVRSLVRVNAMNGGVQQAGHGELRARAGTGLAEQQRGKVRTWVERVARRTVTCTERDHPCHEKDGNATAHA
jgi:hypothetical protein